MFNCIPILGWLLSFLVYCSFAVPFWFLWTYVGISEIYFYWLPPIYLNIPFWDCVWLGMIISILKSVVLPHFGGYPSYTSTKK
jgi:hypothetical protein